MVSIGSLFDSAFAPVSGVGTVPGSRSLLCFEGFAVFVASIALYAEYGSGWPLFLGLFFIPDLSLLGYLRGRRFGAICYNIAHSIAGPAFLAAVALLSAPSALTAFALIWFAHIGFDRALGYGLKSVAGFRYTHLGEIGARAR